MSQHKQLTQGVYDIALYTTECNQKFLIFAQHFGTMEILHPETLKIEYTVKEDKINTIFKIVPLQKKGELAFCAYNGLYFVKFQLVQGKF